MLRLLSCLAISLIGCQGLIKSSGNAKIATSKDALISTCTDTQEAARGTSAASMRRLTRTELINTIRALVGETLLADSGVGERLAGLPLDTTVIAGDFSLSPRVGLASVLAQVAGRVVELADGKWKSEYLAPCAGSAPLTDACVEEVVHGFGARVWRRPLSPLEAQRYLQFYHASGSGDAGLMMLLRRLLQSPSLVFHIEQASAQVTSGRVRLSDYEVASRISYLTCDSAPDATLLQAVQNGELGTLREVSQQVERLLVSDAGHRKLTDFFRYYTRLDAVADPLLAIGQRAGIADTRGLGEEMRVEALAFFDSIVTDGSFSDLMQSTRAFPRTPAMARIFGTQVATQGPVDAVGHAGLLHRPALLVSSTARTSPIVRGAHVRKLFLCDELGLPDPAAVAQRQDAVGNVEAMGNRERVSTLTDAPQCAGCHTLINGVGFSFEGYDQLGMQRTEETALGPDGQPTQTWPIDTYVTAIGIESGGPASVTDSAALVEALALGRKAHACISKRAFEYYHLANVDPVADSCTLREAERNSHDATLRSVFVSVIANEDIFWRKAL